MNKKYEQTIRVHNREAALKLAHFFIMRGWWFNASKQTSTSPNVDWDFTFSNAVDLERDIRMRFPIMNFDLVSANIEAAQ